MAAGSLIGDPINCDKNKVFEDHCWIHGAERAGLDLDTQKHYGCVTRPTCDEDGKECKVSIFFLYMHC